MKERERKVRVNKEVEEGRAEDPKKEFKIEIVKVGKLEENTEGLPTDLPASCLNESDA